MASDLSPSALNRIEQYSLSDADLRKLIGPVRIITYPQLENETYETLFKDQPYIVILFLTENKQTGHWICVLQHQGGAMCEVFDSFGIKVDGNRKWLSGGELRNLDETLPNLHNCFKGFPGKLVYNDTKLQQDSKNTCGRHIASRILHKHLSIQDYIDLIRQSGFTPDVFVTLLTYRIIHK
jgi:hypothetical protein